MGCISPTQEVIGTGLPAEAYMWMVAAQDVMIRGLQVLRLVTIANLPAQLASTPP